VSVVGLSAFVFQLDSLKISNILIRTFVGLMDIGQGQVEINFDFG
jgi:hypothetical protein